MKNFALNIMKAAQEAGHPIQVLCEGDQLYLGNSATKAWEAVKSVSEVCHIIITTDRREAMTVCAYDLAPDENVIDYAGEGFIHREWEKLFAESEG